MPAEPDLKRTVAFFDGQNLFNAAKSAFGYHFPNYDVKALAKAVCLQHGLQLIQTRFYTGVPSVTYDPAKNKFWSKKFLSMRRQKIRVFSRPVRYLHKSIKSTDGQEQKVLVGDEKGIDVRIAIDIISLAFDQIYDVALVFSQGQDLSEAADEIRKIAKVQARWIKIASAFPINQANKKNRGINKTDWLPFDKAVYDACIDPKDYRQ
ncbi:Uncharacterized conserved protein, LabA/DUF88 family [Desulfatibacillum alkenivorans DSM 16219]|jgi:uncharacterized LabA/DUF88 family protein|uniref:Uncharacterized conserved protein, LabA/DUF88 family n=1 Tax=Desulfatibacillum alkenivorans DSM 16219 TaxID=1121393 RepID=A0A1M6L9F5_9BACT|nr:NYN domain-containing protein [Desulfatibacillum alkenivorans]SHJ67795.1 Uncharacterized conserved protein, LabA/DUF88 family [Desulfatibacillum alkenivorans DSM 16219]